MHLAISLCPFDGAVQYMWTWGNKEHFENHSWGDPDAIDYFGT